MHVLRKATVSALLAALLLVGCGRRELDHDSELGEGITAEE
jgi:hypothetical protein